jgi:DNA repair protein RecO (recombination protein O)
MSDLYAAYVLHRRPYRETSLLVDVFTQEHGRFRLVAKGAQRKGKSITPLQLFQPIDLSWAGKSELVNLKQVEATSRPYRLEGSASLCGLYINELLMKLLPEWLAEPALFELYQITLGHLAEAKYIEPTLRLFEQQLLHYLGYDLQLDYEINTMAPILDEAQYRYHPDKGPELSYQHNEQLISGRSLRHLREQSGFDDASLKEIKILMRTVLDYYLGHKSLNSRQLFAEMNRYK